MRCIVTTLREEMVLKDAEIERLKQQQLEIVPADSETQVAAGAGASAKRPGRANAQQAVLLARVHDDCQVLLPWLMSLCIFALRLLLVARWFLETLRTFFVRPNLSYSLALPRPSGPATKRLRQA